MHYRRLASALGLCAALSASPAAEAATAADAKPPSYPCENCGGGVGPFNMEASTDVIVTTEAGHRQRLLNALGLVKIINDRGGSKVLNLDGRYIVLVTNADGQKAWVLNVKQRHPEPQASRVIRRYR